jgi:hypothetical protein
MSSSSGGELVRTASARERAQTAHALAVAAQHERDAQQAEHQLLLLTREITDLRRQQQTVRSTTVSDRILTRTCSFAPNRCQ